MHTTTPYLLPIRYCGLWSAHRMHNIHNIPRPSESASACRGREGGGKLLIANPILYRMACRRNRLIGLTQH